MTMTLIESVWQLADKEMDKLLDGNLEGDKLQQQRGLLKGISTVLAVFGPPFYRTTNEVADELRKRRNMRLAGEPYESPGLGTRRYTLPASVDNKAKPTVAERVDKVLSEKDKQTIRFAYQSMPEQFTHAFLAKKYAVSLAVIAEICS